MTTKSKKREREKEESNNKTEILLNLLAPFTQKKNLRKCLKQQCCFYLTSA